MEILFPDEEKRTDAKSSIDQYEGFLTVYSRGGQVPIEFDYIDYIKCVGCQGGNAYKVASHPIIIEFDGTIGYNFPVDGRIHAREVCPSSDRGAMDILFPEEEKRVRAKSSIDQYVGFISVYERGGWSPIEFDFIDYIKCVDCQGGNKYEVATHPIIIEFDDTIGYNFPIGECLYLTDEYPMFDQGRTELMPLPDFMGDGFYEAYRDSEEIINFDNAALGIRNNQRLKIGQDYYLGSDILPADDGE